MVSGCRRRLCSTYDAQTMRRYADRVDSREKIAISDLLPAAVAGLFFRETNVEE
jgi:hypothetical protein